MAHPALHKQHPCVEIEGVDPLFVPHMLIGAMTAQIASRIEGMDIDCARKIARSIWEADWPCDPEPRCFTGAADMVASELSYWCEG